MSLSPGLNQKDLVLRIFGCKHCQGNFAIVEANDTLIPINCKADDIFEINTKFDREKMRSHLQDCAARRNDWQELKEKYLNKPELRFKKRMDYEKVKTIADKYIKLFKPFAKRIEIAGSIRRKKENVKDIEIVMIRDNSKLAYFKTVIEALPKIKGMAEGKYTQRKLPEGINLDLFFANKENWGLIYAIRTGSAEFSHRVLAASWVKAGYKSKDGMLHKNGVAVPVYEEEQLFEMIGLNWIEPELRN